MRIQLAKSGVMMVVGLMLSGCVAEAAPDEGTDSTEMAEAAGWTLSYTCDREGEGCGCYPVCSNGTDSFDLSADLAPADQEELGNSLGVLPPDCDASALTQTDNGDGTVELQCTVLAFAKLTSGLGKKMQIKDPPP